MRVLHLADRLSERGGAYRHLLAVLESQAEAGHELHLAVGTRERERVRAPCRVSFWPGLEARTAAPVGLEGLLRTLSPDVLHVHTVVNPVALATAAGHRASVATVQDHRFFCPFRGKWKLDGTPCREPMAPEPCAGCFEDADYFREVYGLTEARLAALGGFGAVVALSRYMAGELRGAGVPEAKLHVVAPFVHGLDPTARPDGPPCVLVMGRLVEAKGCLDAVEAHRRSGVRLPLVAAGSGPLREELERRGVEVLGWLDRGRLSATLRRARALLLPSRWQEPFGIAGLEALAFGVPVVAYRSGGVDEWHPGDFLVEWGDVDGLAVALGRAVGARAVPPPGFEAERLMDRLEEVYARAAGRPLACERSPRRWSFPPAR